MRLKVIGTGSKGNAYLLYNDHECLMIECGVNFKDIKVALNFDFSKVVGCILTHEHKDHCKAAQDVLKAGIQIYSSPGTQEAVGMLSNHNSKAFLNGKSFMIGNFKILGFDVKHDAAEPSGFLIHHPECGNVLFLTDTYYCAYTFKNLNNIIIEANYSDEIIAGKMTEMEFLKNRIIQSHMSLATCIKAIKANDISAVHNIVLIHLSDSNSNEKQFKKEVMNSTGCIVSVANNGDDIPFNKTPF